MPRHLLLLTIGPVQTFIAQARRTRDLWSGSALLSEVSGAAAMAIAEEGTDLDFPASASSAEGVANKILALVYGAPRDLATRARDAARATLRDHWRTGLEKHAALVDPAALETAEEQIEKALDVNAAWVPCDDDGAYAAAREQVEALLAGRRTLNDFAPWRRQRGDVHKSSLDGARETVLPRTRGHALFARYRIGAREELDAIGLLKRTYGEPGQFVPVPTIALAAWIAQAAQADDGRKDLEALRKACSDRRLPGIRSDKEWVKRFPFDAQIFLPGRLPAYLDENGIADDGALRGRVDTILRNPRLPQPYPYVACLVADGDRMGDAIRLLARDGHLRHQKLSIALAGFAEKARSVVEAHEGVLVYAGGDDVLAFVSLPRALDCAAKLASAFTETVGPAVATVGVRPTLSVGLGVGHVLSSLADLVEPRARRRAPGQTGAQRLGDCPRDARGLAERLGRAVGSGSSRAPPRRCGRPPRRHPQSRQGPRVGWPTPPGARPGARRRRWMARRPAGRDEAHPRSDGPRGRGSAGCACGCRPRD